MRLADGEDFHDATGPADDLDFGADLDSLFSMAEEDMAEEDMADDEDETDHDVRLELVSHDRRQLYPRGGYQRPSPFVRVPVALLPLAPRICSSRRVGPCQTFSMR